MGLSDMYASAQEALTSDGVPVDRAFEQVAALVARRAADHCAFVVETAVMEDAALAKAASVVGCHDEDEFADSEAQAAAFSAVAEQAAARFRGKLVCVTPSRVCARVAREVGDTQGTLLDPFAGTGELLAAAAPGATLLAHEEDRRMAEWARWRFDVAGLEATVRRGHHLDLPEEPEVDAVICGLPRRVWKAPTATQALPVRSTHSTVVGVQAAIATLRVGGTAAFLLPLDEALTDDRHRNFRELLLKACDVREVVVFREAGMWCRHGVLLTLVKRHAFQELRCLRVSEGGRRSYCFPKEYATRQVRFSRWDPDTDQHTLLAEVPAADMALKRHALDWRRYADPGATPEQAKADDAAADEPGDE